MESERPKASTTVLDESGISKAVSIVWYISRSGHHLINKVVKISIR